MIHLIQIQTTLLFCATSYLCLEFFFRNALNQPLKRKSALLISVITVVALFAVKMFYDSTALSINYYNLLEVGRHDSMMDIRKSYKVLSRKYHPDKNPDVSMQDMFQSVKDSYDILMDEELRDTYNRFGSHNLEFDPRKDEMKLIADVAVKYIFFGIVMYIMTIPNSNRASRTWIIILGIALLAIEASFLLTDTSIPIWMPKFLTEYELLFYLDSAFPLVIVLLSALAKSLYVDVDQTTVSVLHEILISQKLMNSQLGELEVLFEANKKLQESGNGQGLDSVRNKIMSISDSIEQANETLSARIDDLKSSSANPGSNYYWIIFVLLYGGIFFLQ